MNNTILFAKTKKATYWKHESGPSQGRIIVKYHKMNPCSGDTFKFTVSNDLDGENFIERFKNLNPGVKLKRLYRVPNDGLPYSKYSGKGSSYVSRRGNVVKSRGLTIDVYYKLPNFGFPNFPNQFRIPNHATVGGSKIQHPIDNVVVISKEENQIAGLKARVSELNSQVIDQSETIQKNFREVFELNNRIDELEEKDEANEQRMGFYLQEIDRLKKLIGDIHEISRKA